MKTFLKRIIFKFFGAKIYYCVEALYTSKFKFKSLKYVKIKVDNLELHLQSSKVSSIDFTRILWSGPKTLLVMSNKNIIEII